MAYPKLILAFLAYSIGIHAAALPAASPAWAAGESYQKTVLYHHNIHRANHSATDVTWDTEMKQDAKILASSCLWGHNTTIGGGGYGQNIAAGYSRFDIGAAITDGFYNDEMPSYSGQYGKKTPDMSIFGSFGHFTQVVWKGTKNVGCATVDCDPQGGLVDAASGQVLDGLRYFTVCNYWPAGNFLGEFADNVGKPLGKATVNV